MSPFCLLQVPLHPPPPRPGTTSRFPDPCARRCPLWAGGERESRFSSPPPAQTLGCLLKPDNAGKCLHPNSSAASGTARPCPGKSPPAAPPCGPLSLGTRDQSWLVGPTEGSAEQEGSVQPRWGRREAQVLFSLGTGAFLPAYSRKRILSLPVGSAGARLLIFIWRAAALDSSGPKIMRGAL